MEGSIGKNQTFIPLQTHTFQPLKYCLVTICYVFISLFSCSSCVLFYIYIAPSGFFFFLEEAEGTFWYLWCSTSDLEPTLIQTNGHSLPQAKYIPEI